MAAQISLIKKIKLWAAINRYAEACGGDTSANTASTLRQDFVAEIEGIWTDGISDAIESEGIELCRCRNCGDPRSVHSKNRCCAECECRRFLP